MSSLGVIKGQKDRGCVKSVRSGWRMLFFKEKSKYLRYRRKDTENLTQIAGGGIDEGQWE